MQAHPGDADALTPLLELRGTVARANGAQIRKERTRSRPGAEHFLHFRRNADERGLAGFLPCVVDDPGLPVDVFRFEKRDVGLRRADVPG